MYTYGLVDEENISGATGYEVGEQHGRKKKTRKLAYN